MPRLKIDNAEVEVDAGATVLDAARKTGANVPTLCHMRETGGLASCMVCVVRDKAAGRMLPACSMAAADGMDIDTCGEEVITARRDTIAMLLSEHAGDCEAPCSRVCPAGLDIPRMMRLMAAGDTAGAALVANRDLIFPATLGRICQAPCQNVCRRAQYDSTVKIRECHAALGGGAEPARAQPTGKRVAVVGAGLAGLSAAYICALRGHTCRVYDESAAACAELLECHPEFEEIIRAEIASICEKGVELLLGSAISAEKLIGENDAVIFAGAGAVARPAPESEAPNVFQAPEHTMAVRAVANGKSAALAADAYLRGRLPAGRKRRYNSALGKLRPEEIEPYSATRRAAEPAGEAERCLGCDCRMQVTCKLRQYADDYGIQGGLKRHMTRPPVCAPRVLGPVIFESNKCIKCGICVEICRQSGSGAGFSFAGRGLDTRIGTPFGAVPDAELAIRCAEACPTGALTLSDFEERP